MLLRTIATLAGISLLSACTVFSWGEDSPERAGSEEAKQAAALEVPPDLTRPAVSTQYAIPAPKGSAAASAPAQTADEVRDVETRLKELQSLRDKGLITDQELLERRKAILGSL